MSIVLTSLAILCFASIGVNAATDGEFFSRVYNTVFGTVTITEEFIKEKEGNVYSVSGSVKDDENLPEDVRDDTSIGTEGDSYAGAYLTGDGKVMLRANGTDTDITDEFDGNGEYKFSYDAKDTTINATAKILTDSKGNVAYKFSLDSEENGYNLLFRDGDFALEEFDSEFDTVSLTVQEKK